jgi:CCS family citrate carrier protein
MNQSTNTALANEDMSKKKQGTSGKATASAKPARAQYAAQPANEGKKRSFHEVMWKLCEYKIGVVPLPIYALLAVLIGAFALTEEAPHEITMFIAVISFFGSTCAELGKRIPIIRSVGGTVILATFIPSYMVYRGWIPTHLLEPVVMFTKSTNFIYLFISCVIVGSILGMNRDTLIKGFLRIFVPLSIGSVLAAITGTITGTLLGIGMEKTFFFIVVPIMAGGVGEGAIPLSIGYSQILGLEQGAVFAEVLPVVMLGSLTAILLAGGLNHLGKKKPQWSGNGQLTKSGDDVLSPGAKEREGIMFDAGALAAGGLLAVALYLSGVLFHQFFGLPAPVAMLFLAVAVKLAKAAPPKLEDGAFMMYRFFSVGVTYPLLFAIGVSMTPWDKLVSAFTPSYLLTIIVTVCTLVATGFFVGRKMNMYPIEAAIVNACHSGQGGTGDIAILTAANRMVLMPFAQISTRIGGAITVTLAIMALAHLH